jgi:DNA-binding transcriptional LysR family regulator
MELRHLRYFVTVAEELHFTRAAQRLHIGQPPLSQQIQALEEEIGAQLLERSKRWVRLTEAGRLFLDDARRILSLSEQAAETARRASRGEVGELRIGFTSSTPFSNFLPSVINTYRQRFPHVTLALQEMTTMRQIEAIAGRTLDLGFVRPPEVAIPDAVRLTALRDDPLVLVLPIAHPLAVMTEIALQDLREEFFVMYAQDAGTGIYPHIVRLCRERGFEPKVVQQARDASTILGLVAAGCGISILPESFQCVHIQGVCYRPITDRAAVTTLMLARRSEGVAPLVDSFFELARMFHQEDA